MLILPKREICCSRLIELHSFYNRPGLILNTNGAISR